MLLRHWRDVQTLAHIALCLACYYLALAHSWFWVIGATALSTVAIAHNHAHVPIFRARWLNWLMDVVLQATNGLPQMFWKFHHLQRHHPHPWGERDWSSPFAYRTAESPSRPVGRTYFCWTYMPIFISQSFVELIRRARPREIAQFVATSLALAALYAALVREFGARQCLLVFAFTYWRAGIALGNTNYLQHWACYRNDGEHWAWTFTGKWINFLAYNQGYHLLHHLKPSLHWSELAAEHRRDPSYTVPELIEDGLYPPLRGRKGYQAWLDDKLAQQAARLAGERAAVAARPNEFEAVPGGQLFPVG